MKTLAPSEVSTIAMTTGNEKRFHKIVHDGQVKEWVGFGWITDRPATKADYRRLHVVVDASA